MRSLLLLFLGVPRPTTLSNTTTRQHLLLVISKAPWWVGALMAGLSFLILRWALVYRSTKWHSRERGTAVLEQTIGRPSSIVRKDDARGLARFSLLLSLGTFCRPGEYGSVSQEESAISASRVTFCMH